MKFPLWTLSLPVIALFTVFQVSFDLAEQGRLESSFLRGTVYPLARTMHGLMTDIKFHIRGTIRPKQKIVIIAADDKSIDLLGRWPWQRRAYAEIIHTAFKNGVKQMGLDVAFSEPEHAVPQELYEIIQKSAPKLLLDAQSFEGDPILADVVSGYKNRLVLGYAAPLVCQPRYDAYDQCPIDDPEVIKTLDEEVGKFSLEQTIPIASEILVKTPLSNLLTSLPNIKPIREAARYSGNFDINLDSDGSVRRYPLFTIHGNRMYPSLALQLAELAKADSFRVDFTPDARIEKAYFLHSPNELVPATRLGYIDLNFRGKAESFPYVSVSDLLQLKEKPKPEVSELLKDSIALFGATAIGIYDMRAFPFDSNTPGVEGHATALDNLLSQDSLKSPTSLNLDWLPLTLLISLGVIFSFLFSTREAVPSLIIFAVFILVFGYIDVKVLFTQNINFPTVFVLLESICIFVLIQAVRYVLEEKNKRYIRMAFSHYLAPAVVDLMLKDPSKLAVGGDRKPISILFSDLRGFTTISEGMDPKTLSQFLNEYLTEMTEIVFEYGGTLDKYIGDAVMAFWGAPLEMEDHAFKACLAGLRMQSRLREIAPHFKEKYNVDVAMGVGINSGEVSVGNMGSARIFEYTVIGDHVNLASRLEGLTKMYGAEILTTRNTLEALPESVRKQVSFRVLDSVKVKGKNKAVDLIEIKDLPYDEKALELFYLAKEKFKLQQWDQAIDYYQKSNQVFTAVHGTYDKVCEIFISRCEEFKKNPPSSDWDGSIEMRTK